MADFDELKDKKYPDSIIDEEEIAEPVIKEEPKPEVDLRQFLMVYAGPGYFNAQNNNPFGGLNGMMMAAGKPVTEDVYAGPGMMGELGSEEPCEEETPAEETADGSESSEQSEEGCEKKEPVEGKENSDGKRNPYEIYNDPRMMAAYAGPAFPDPAVEALKNSMTSKPTMMLVYAAPPLPKPGRIGITKDEPNRTNGPKFCTMCGTKLIPGAKFCPECGYMVQYPNDGGVQNC